ncbi:MAG: ornithine cyclodeaminase family protein [Candidatus Dormibacter sp.]
MPSLPLHDLRGVVCLHSLADGELLGVADSATVTSWRTGLSAAIATHALSRSDAETLGVIGAATQAELTLLGLTHLRSIKEIVLSDIDRRRAENWPLRPAAGSPSVTVVDSAADVAAASEMILIATWSTTAILSLADVDMGQHVTSLGSDEPGKQELAADLLRAGTLVVDNRALAASGGAVAAAGLDIDIDATLGEVIRGEHSGRRDGTERTLYTPVGLPWQDLALAWHAHELAERNDLGIAFDLLS